MLAKRRWEVPASAPCPWAHRIWDRESRVTGHLVAGRPSQGWKRPAFNGLVPTDHDTLDTATVLSYRSVGSVARIPKALRMVLPTKTIWLTASALSLLALATSASAQDVEWADAMKAAERALTESR